VPLTRTQGIRMPAASFDRGYVYTPDRCAGCQNALLPWPYRRYNPRTFPSGRFLWNTGRFRQKGIHPAAL